MIKMLSVSNACLGEACLHGKGRCVGLQVLQFCFYRSGNKESQVFRTVREGEEVWQKKSVFS